MNEDRPDIDELLDKASELEEQGSPLAAMRLLRRALDVREDPVILTRIGSLSLDLDQWKEAEEALLSAIRVDPDFSPAYTFLGLVYRAQGRLEAALRSLEKASRDEPSGENFTLLGLVQADLGFSNEGQESYRKSILIDPSHLEAYYNLAVELRYEQRQEAIVLFQKAIDIDSTYACAHRELGWVLRRTDQFPEAEYHLRRAIELDRSDGWAYIYLGNLMSTLGDFTAAADAYLRAIEVWPDRSVSYWCFAHLRESQGRRSEAEILYRKALEIDPGDAQANWRFGNYLRNIGDYRGAKQYFGNAVELDSNDKRAAAALTALEGRATDSPDESLEISDDEVEL